MKEEGAEKCSDGRSNSESGVLITPCTYEIDLFPWETEKAMDGRDTLFSSLEEA